MLLYQTINNVTSVRNGFKCDCCKKDYLDILEIQESLHHHNTCGYGSVFGYDTEYSIDL